MTAHIARSMISADFLKLRRRRALFWWSLILTCGAMVAAFVTLVTLHLNDPARYGPAGGVKNFTGAVEALIGLAGVASIMIGATAGSGDLGAGVFRDLVSTGRSRAALFLVRVPGALLLQLPLVLASFAIVTVASIALAGGLPTPDAGLIAHEGAWLLASTVLDLVLAIGVASLIGSRATTIGVLLAWETIASHLLQHFSFLGNLRDALNSTALDQLNPNGVRVLTMPLAAAVAVLVCWVAAAIAIGAWRTHTVDA